MVFAETLLFFTEPFFFCTEPFFLVQNHFSGVLPSGKAQKPFYQKVGSAKLLFFREY
jgi:hypothetical protein